MAELWTNWAGDQRCAPARIVRPRGEAELAELLASTSGKVKAAGTGHSFTDIACTDGTLIDLSGMAGVIDADPGTGLVRLGAGIRIADAARALSERGLALENQGDIDKQALAGAIATATHGTGARFRNLSAQVAGVRLVTASGEVLELDESSPDLLGARVSLGALGVLSEITMRCVPRFTIDRVDEPRPLADVLGSLEHEVDANHHFEFFVFPYAQRVLTLTSERTDRDPRPPSPRRAKAGERLENGALAAATTIGRLAPRAVPAVNRAIAALISRKHHLDLSHRIYAHERAVRFTEMEYAIPRESVREALERVLALIERRRLPVNFPIEVRFAAPDDAWLSTAHGRETGYIAVHVSRGVPHESYFRGVEEIMDDYEGRPHWGKRHYQSAATLRERYPDWDRWHELRARVDPGGRFENDYVRRVLGPVKARRGRVRA